MPSIAPRTRVRAGSSQRTNARRVHPTSGCMRRALACALRGGTAATATTRDSSPYGLPRFEKHQGSDPLRVSHTVTRVEDKPALLLSIDLEDWHQLVHRRLGRADWDRPHPAFPPQVRAVLDLLDELGARATFFLLGMTVANYRGLVRELVERGHEPASHGYAHVRVHEQTRDEFRADVERSVEVIEAATKRRPIAYRAPAFSINRRTPWPYEVLADLGFRCDSSQY